MLQPDKKENLILIHSFPTNSILLKGLTEYLEDFFTVYFIDLPGFTSEIPALEKISLEEYASFVENKIKELNLDNYLIGGISFGFAVINKIHFDPKRCKAVIAMEPYINTHYLHLSFVRHFMYSHLLNVLVDREVLIEKIWKLGYADEALAYLTGQPNERMKIMLEEINCKTFLGTAKCLIENEEEPVFNQNIPYVLAVNKEDATVNAEEIVKLFEKNIINESLLIIYTNIEHYPLNISKEYFQERLKSNQIEEIVQWANALFLKRQQNK